MEPGGETSLTSLLLPLMTNRLCRRMKHEGDADGPSVA